MLGGTAGLGVAHSPARRAAASRDPSGVTPWEPPAPMDADTPRRRWYHKKRWLAVVASALLAAYPLSVGPMVYADARGWLPASVTAALAVIHSPLEAWADREWPLGDILVEYAEWAAELGERHAASD